MEPVLLNDFRRLPSTLRHELLLAAAQVLESGRYVLGEHMSAFERSWAAYCGTNYAVGVGNGMDAIEIGLRSCNVGPGDEVITTPITAFATVLGILRAEAIPVLADVDPSTGLLDPRSVVRCITQRTRAVLLVHLYGQMRAIDIWEKLCASHNICLFEDAAQAHGASWQARRAGSVGRWAAYSFYPTKNLGCIGDGGALCTNDKLVSETASKLRNYGQADRYHHPIRGLNSRLDELQAAFLQRLLVHFPEATLRRQRIAAQYHERFRSPRVTLLAKPLAPESHVYHLFVVRTSSREALQSHLADRKVQSLIHYPVCVHLQPPTLELARDPDGLPAAEQFANECLSIPCHPYMNESEIERVISAVNTF
jgi:dTDP-4-amino-4,6-dideoxygalactose transaminase